MAQTKKKRRRKRRGTQGGRIDTKGRAGRPRSREEAKARARSRPQTERAESRPAADLAQLGRSAALFAAVVFALLLVVIFKKPVGASLIFGAFMLVFYIPAGYFIDMTLWRRRERARIRERQNP